MKKMSLLAILIAAVMSLNATDLWTGSKHVSWDDGGVDIAANMFNDAQPGQKIVVHYTDASDGIEFKLLDEWSHLPGVSRCGLMATAPMSSSLLRLL